MENANVNRMNVAAVCGAEVRIYGWLDEKTQIRPFQWKEQFPTHGAALQFATEYDERQRGKKTK
jgi:hypothetical protein